MLSTVSVASFGAFLSLVAGAATECEPGPPSAAPKLLQLGSHTETTETAQQIINKHFHGIPRGGSSVRSNLVAMNERPHDVKTKTAAWACSSIDFAKFHGALADGPKVRKIMETLKITEYCGLTEGNGTANSDSTCRAFWAGIRAHIELQNLNFIPVFENMAVVNWYAKKPGHFPSWGSDRDAVSVKYTQGKVTNFEIHRHNAVSPYAFCDIVYTVLRQNFDQAGRGQCGPTAFLTALANTSPAGAIKSGLELYWTGKLEHAELHSLDPQCDYIYHDMPPGIVPFEEGQPGTEVVGVLPVGPCKGNAGDCAEAQGTPFTNSGIQGMWAIFFSTLFNGYGKHGDCKEEHRVVWVRYPGMNLQHDQFDDGVSIDRYNDFMWYMIGWSAESAYEEYQEFPADPLKAGEMLDEICASPHGAVVVLSVSLLSACMWDERFQHGMGSSPEDPFKLEGSTWKCGDKILSEPDQWLGNDYWTDCHAVYVDQCYPNGAVSIWTWTGRLYLHRSALLGWGVTRQHELWDQASALWGAIMVPSLSGNLALEATERLGN